MFAEKKEKLVEKLEAQHKAKLNEIYRDGGAGTAQAKALKDLEDE